MTAPIHLYKLITGETIIAEFHGEETVNERTNAKVHMITRPALVSGWYELSDAEWIPGLANQNQPLPLSVGTIVVYVEAAEIDETVIEQYMILLGDEAP